MPVIPNFSGFAATPNLASSFLGGVKISQDAAQESARLGMQSQRIAAEAASDAQRIAFGREQLAARQVENQMELEAKQKMVEQQALQKSHEASIEAAYKNTQFGLAERRLKQQESITNMRLEEAARGVKQNYGYERTRQALIANGADEKTASEQAMRETGFGATGFSKAFTGQNKPPPMDREASSKIKGLEQRIALEHASLRKELDDGKDADNDKIGIIKGEIARMERQKAQLFQQSRAGISIPAGVSGTNTPTKIGRFKILQ